jgi:hypothetical protein
MIAQWLGRRPAAVWFVGEVVQPLLDDILRTIRKVSHRLTRDGGVRSDLQSKS